MSVLALLAGSKGDKSKSSKARITRDAFLFLTPASTGAREDFAQCGPSGAGCRMFVPEEYLKGKLKGDRCIIHGSKQAVSEYMSCGFMVPWPTPDGSPVEEVVKAHAEELLKSIPGSVTAKDSGLVDRRVQCHRCRFASSRASHCDLYDALNQTFPQVFDLDVKITPNSCCNAQEPR
jgi:hypothetical protein